MLFLTHNQQCNSTEGKNLSKQNTNNDDNKYAKWKAVMLFTFTMVTLFFHQCYDVADWLTGSAN